MYEPEVYDTWSYRPLRPQTLAVVRVPGLGAKGFEGLQMKKSPPRTFTIISGCGDPKSRRQGPKRFRSQGLELSAWAIEINHQGLRRRISG